MSAETTDKPFAIVGKGTLFDGAAYWATLVGVYLMVGGLMFYSGKEKLFDDDGKPVKQGDTGRIFVGNEMQFEGYTGGGNKDVIEGLMSSGDVGHFDSDGRLFIDGRDDEMIVSGGENVFPREVEDLLAGHDHVKEVAVIGVDDEEFGQRLKAFIVLTDGGSLDEEGVKSHVKQNLARYKVPRDVEFLDELPRNSTGKILKRELVEDDSADTDSDDDDT